MDELIGVLKSEVLRLNGVLESFRDFASLQRLTMRPADVLGVLEEIVRLIAPQAEQQRVEVTLRPPEPDLPRVPLDAEKFKQAVLNLVINALEAMPDGGSWSSRASARRRRALDRGRRHRSRAFPRRSSKTCSSPTSRPRTGGPAWGWP